MSPNQLMSLSPKMSPAVARRIAAACGAGVLLVGAAGCGSSDSGTPTGSTQNEGAQTSQNGSGPTGQGQLPGADGKVAAVVDTTAQVQGQNGQVAVTWNGSTTFTQQVEARLADVEVGTCVVVQSASSAADDSSEAPTEAAATSVRIAPKGADGTCAAGLGGGGPRLSTNGGQPPSGFPSGAPTDVPGGGNGGPRMRAFGGAVGEVTAVSAGGFTVKSSVPQLDGSAPSAGSTPKVSETSVAVTVSSATTYTTTGKATAADVKVGSCLRAQGETDDTGAVTAKTIALSPAVDGECTSGFRRGTAGDGPEQNSQES
ncbi:hypothetical protein ABIE44_002976 [Marmoricola sp. OAE513]|uniref:hypothetical protein n=1 Tax=Marmoricola sp. OAE513 TaxID=2817894 RepID=UPI001AE48D5B